MAETHHVFLIPGFFGFANIGELLYFAHVKKYLPQAFEAVGLQAKIYSVQTYPTSSIRRRAERLLEIIQENAKGDESPIHLIGHSSGGLDARLLVTPGVSLRNSAEIEPWVQRVKTVVTISTPHHGTPVASFFTSLFGQKFLGLLSLSTIYTLRFGRLPSSMLFRIGALIARLDDYIGWKNNILDQLYDQLLDDFSTERRQAVEHFFSEMGADQALLPQLTPEGIDVFNAATCDRPGVRYGSVISYARRPGVVSTYKVGIDPYGQATHALFYGMYRLASGMSEEHIPQLSEEQMDSLLLTYGMIPDRKANDGVVPTISQIWGEIIHATRADHLDVLGHFGDPKYEPPHIDWLTSGTGFGRRHFEALWNDVVDFVIDKHSRVSRSSSTPIQHLQHLFSN